MPLFCQICENLLSVVTSVDEFYYKCTSCQQNYKPDANDSLRYEDIKGSNLIIYKTILQNAAKDPVNPKVRKECKCGNDIVTQVRLGDELKLVNTCTKCNKQWLEGTE